MKLLKKYFAKILVFTRFIRFRIFIILQKIIVKLDAFSYSLFALSKLIFNKKSSYGVFWENPLTFHCKVKSEAKRLVRTKVLPDIFAKFEFSRGFPVVDCCYFLIACQFCQMYRARLSYSIIFYYNEKFQSFSKKSPC